VGVGAHPVGRGAVRGTLAVVTWWIGLFVCRFGTRMFRMFVFPLCFLLGLVPLPEFAVNHIESLLQQGSADAANRLFVIAGVPVTRDGLQLSIPGLTVEVATECSSIRSSLMLLVTSMVLGPSPAAFHMGESTCHSGGYSSFHR
jgi:hypothetical protein